jgi:hypothetical protein
MKTQKTAIGYLSNLGRPGGLKVTTSGKNMSGRKKRSAAAFAGGQRRAPHRAMGTQMKKARTLSMLPGVYTRSSRQQRPRS